jgi:hypothetical protein
VIRVALGGLVWIAVDALLTLAMFANWADSVESTGVLIPAQATSPGGGIIGLSMTGLLSSLGSAVAVVAVTSCFLRFLKKQRLEQREVLERFRRSYSESQQKFQEQLDWLIGRHELVEKKFQDQVNGIIEEQNAILLEAIRAMKSLEENLGCSSATVQAILNAVASLELAVAALDIWVQQVTVRGVIPPLEEMSP